LTLAATKGSFVLGGIMLAVYGAGMVVPLFIIAALWTRVGTRTRSILRGGSVTVFGRRLPIVSMITGVLMIAVGIVFWATNGLVATNVLVPAPSLVPTTTLAHAQEWVSSWSSTTTDIIVVCVLAILAIALWFRYERRRARRTAAADQGDAASGQGGAASGQG